MKSRGKYAIIYLLIFVCKNMGEKIKMIEAILFDFDGVLTVDKTGSQSVLRCLSAKTGIAEDALGREYYKYNKALLYGKMTHRDMWEDFQQALGKEIPFEILRDAFRNTILDWDMIEYARELKQNYLLGLITDNKADRMEEILTWYQLKDLFDAVAVSAQCGYGKQEMPIFEMTLDALQVKPEACVFIDNTEKNLVIPRQMGLRTILFDDENRDMGQFKKELQAILV